MAFLVTARKWRPQLFSEVVGQQHITTTLKNAIENDRIGHAYIFAGPRGVGKTTTARILAKRLNCKSPNGGEPCNKCEACDHFLKSQSLDIIEIDGASNRRIDEIRTLRESVKYAPTSGEYKVYIIDEVHMLTTESFNALLKTLEEPPEHTIFIFATTDIHKVPLTIISRCQRYDFRRIELDEIKELLKHIADAEKIKIDDESLTLIAKKADGALRDAESIFDQVVSFCGNKIDVKILRQMLNLIDDDIYFDISNAVLTKDFKTAFEVSEKIYNNGWNYIDFINGLVEHFRNITTAVVSKTTNYIESAESIKEKYIDYLDKFSEGDLLRILAFLTKVSNELKFSQNHKLKVEISLTHLIGLERSSTISEILSGNIKQDFNIDKKKTKVVNNSAPVTKTQKLQPPKPEKLIPDFEIPKPEKKKSGDVKTTPEEKEVETKEIIFKSKISLDEVKEGWSNFKSIITKNKFTLGPLLEHAFPTDVRENTVLIEVSQNDDVTILRNGVDFLNKRFSEIYEVKAQLKFKYNKEILKELGENKMDDLVEDESYKEHPLVKSIISELGGREIK